MKLIRLIADKSHVFARRETWQLEEMRVNANSDTGANIFAQLALLIDVID